MDKQYEQKSLIIIAVVAAITLFFGIWSVPLLDPDEPVYAETAREMIEFGDWLSPRIYNNFWYDKPPMYYWLIAICQTIFGDNEFSARFPSAFLAFGTSMMLYMSVTKLFNEKAGFWSAIILTTSLEFFYMSKAAVTDCTLLFFMTGALLSFLHKKYWLMYICMGLGTLTKGPIGIVFPGAIIFLYLVFMGQLRQILEMHVIRGLLLYVLVAGPWYYAMYTVHGMDFINTFLGFHNITRFTTPEHAGRVKLWYYLPVLIAGLFPWTGILIQSLVASIKESRIDDMRTLVFMQIWWVFVFIFFTICKTKLISYILPVYPALAIIIGWNISRLLYKQRHNTTYHSLAFGSLLMFVLLGVGAIFGSQKMPELTLSGIVLGILLIILGIGIVIFFLKFRDIEISAGIHALAGMLLMVIAIGFMVPDIASRWTTKGLASYYLEQADQKAPLYVDKFLHPSFMYYTHNPGQEISVYSNTFTAALTDGQHKYIVVRGKPYRELVAKQQVPTNVKIMQEQGGNLLLEQE